MLAMAASMIYSAFFEGLPEEKDLRIVELDAFYVKCKVDTSSKGVNDLYKVIIEKDKIRYNYPKSFKPLKKCNKFSNKIKENKNIIITYRFNQTIFDIIQENGKTSLHDFEIYMLKGDRGVYLELQTRIEQEMNNLILLKISVILLVIVMIPVSYNIYQNKKHNK